MNPISRRAGPGPARRISRGPSVRGQPAAVLAGAAGALLAAAAANHLLARRSERRHPPAGRFVSVDGVRLHYVERGTGPAVVLIHGNGVTLQEFVLSGLFDRLARSHRVLAFDRPGFGYSGRPRDRAWTARDQAQALLAALTQLGVRDAVLVAHSWGTLAALQAALAAPERVRGLVLMSGYYWPTARLDAVLMGGPAIPGLGDVMRYTVSPVLGRLLTPLLIRRIFSPAKVPTRFKAGFAASMSLRPSQIRAAAAEAAMMPLEAARAAARYDEVRAPALVISGDGDRIVSFEAHSRRLARELLGGQIQVIPGAGHMVHHTAPEAVGDAIEDFLAQVGVGVQARPYGSQETVGVREALPA